MTSIMVHGFHRLGSFLSGQKWNLRSWNERQGRRAPMVPGLSFISPAIRLPGSERI